MLEMLQDPFWQFVVGTVLTLATLVVGILGLRAYRTRKLLSYKVVLRERLLGIRQGIEGRVQITFDDEPVRDVQMFVLHLLNTGNVSIEEADYVRPLGFDFGSEAKLLNVEITETKPATMTVDLETKTNGFTVRPDVFNGGDGLEFQVLLTGLVNLKAEGRVKDVSEVREIKQKDTNMLWFFSVAFGPVLLLLIALTLVRMFDLFDPQKFIGDSALILIVFSPFLVGFAYILREQRNWRRL